MRRSLVAVFSVAECKKYQRYADFGQRFNPFENMKSADPDALQIQKAPPPVDQIPQSKWKTVAFDPVNTKPPPSAGVSLGKIAGTVAMLGVAYAAGEGINRGVLYYLRTRRTKNGKVVTERVRKKNNG